MLALRLALRNVFRYARRSLITAITIAVAFAMLVLTIGVSEGSYRSVVDSAARTGTGHVLVQAPGYDLLEPTALADPDAILATIAAQGQMLAAPRTQSLALVNTTTGSAPMLALGVEPQVERSVSLLPDALIEGEWLPDTPGRVPGAVVGRGTARRLKVDLGEKLVLTAEGSGEAQLVRLSGIFSTGSSAVDDNLIVVDREVIGRLLGDPAAVHQIAILLDDLRDADAVRDELAPEVDAEVLTWAQALPEIGDYIAMDRAGASATFLILFGLVGLAILNSILMSVFERSRELAVLLALGTPPRTVFTMVVIEGVLLSGLAVALGLALGWACVWWLGRDGLDLSSLTGGQDMDAAGYVMEAVIYPVMDTGRTVEGVLMVIGLTVVAVLYPAWRAARVPPIEAISRQ